MVEDASENRTERQAEICGGNGESEHFASHLGRKRGYEDRYICGKDHRRAHTLQQPEGDDRLNVPRQRAQQSEDGKQNLACYQNRLFAVQVREVSESCLLYTSGIWHGSDPKYIVYGFWNGIIITASLLLEQTFERNCRRLEMCIRDRVSGIDYKVCEKPSEKLGEFYGKNRCV